MGKERARCRRGEIRRGGMQRKAEKENEHAICTQVSALAMDPSGARVITGGYDYEVRLWDFAGMDSSLQSFRTIRPCERQVVRVVSKGSGCWILLQQDWQPPDC